MQRKPLKKKLWEKSWKYRRRKCYVWISISGSRESCSDGRYPRFYKEHGKKFTRHTFPNYHFESRLTNVAPNFVRNIFLLRQFFLFNFASLEKLLKYNDSETLDFQNNSLSVRFFSLLNLPKANKCRHCSNVWQLLNQRTAERSSFTQWGIDMFSVS